MLQTHIGTVYLKVADFARQLRFYQDIIGLRLHRHEENVAYLGAGGDDLLALIHTPQGVRVKGATGLYHFALRVPSRFDLALVLKHLAQTNTPLQGLSDHFVSEAIYLADPEGNGIEIYRDRPLDEWNRDGKMHMTTEPMDINGVMAALNGREDKFKPLPPETDMGHIHLHVGSISEAEAFYGGLLDMDVMFSVGSATFMAYDGYHHHVGANIWGGRTPPPRHALGLDHFILKLADDGAINHAQNRLQSADVPFSMQEGGFIVHDPSENKIHVRITL